MSDLDIIGFTDSRGRKHYAIRAIYDKWVAAGKPPVNSAGRLYDTQKMLYDRWRAGWAGYYPADNPDSTTQPLAHVRFAALDIDATPERVKALAAQGLVRPYAHEPWHWELKNVRNYPKIYAIPASADSQPFPTTPAQPGTVPVPPEEDDMEAIIKTKDMTVRHLFRGGQYAFTSQRDYDLYRAEVEFFRGKGSISALALPALKDVVGIEWDTYGRLLNNFGVPVDNSPGSTDPRAVKVPAPVPPVGVEPEAPEPPKA